MRIFLAVLAATLMTLAACAPAMQGHRRADAPMQAIVGFDPARFAGDWHEVAAIGRTPGARWHVEPGAGGALGVTTSRDGAGQGRVIAPGRFTLSTFRSPLWVLWADADMRSVLLGTPDGSFAILLDRASAMPPDRLRAAREILDWNGYDLGALH
ncbi:lipocalin family protein [Sinisalibacter aestuarii]|uniref:Lipocalin n=1 Tax=Sinisalibacter aestuarii TaxID=2949426 RepID=A0ABQ5LWX5_9RHOB|nr:lipocalin family protein [Sinisalibacter aestuarii]GKY88597.1 lipocalin [Sinisalibacter aestuarii]